MRAIWLRAELERNPELLLELYALLDGDGLAVNGYTRVHVVDGGRCDWTSYALDRDAIALCAER